jgi:MarR family transcriptional regulator, lower aerobic nicotinate degradation pathway regulator
LVKVVANAPVSRHIENRAIGMRRQPQELREIKPTRSTAVRHLAVTEQTAEEHLIYRMGRVVAHANEHLEKKLRPLGLTIDSFRVLFVLSRIPSRTVKQLASDTIIHKSTLSRQLARMERAGLVRRTADEQEDGRYVSIRLTQFGSTRFRKAIRVATSEYDRVVAGLSAPDVESFIKVLDFIAVNVIPSKQRDARLFVPKRSGGNTGRELRSPARRR